MVECDIVTSTAHKVDGQQQFVVVFSLYLFANENSIDDCSLTLSLHCGPDVLCSPSVGLVYLFLSYPFFWLFVACNFETEMQPSLFGFYYQCLRISLRCDQPLLRQIYRRNRPSRSIPVILLKRT